MRSTTFLLSCVLALFSLSAASIASAHNLAASVDPLPLQLCTTGCDQGSSGSSCLGTLDPAPGSPPFTTDSCIVGAITFLDESLSATKAFTLAGGPYKGDWVLAFFTENHNSCQNFSAVYATTLEPTPQSTCETAGFSINGNMVTDFIVGSGTPAASSSSSTGTAEDPSGGDHHALIIGLAVGGGVAALVAVGVAVWCCKRRSAANQQPLDADYTALQYD
jgi:hypothetical protein